MKMRFWQKTYIFTLLLFLFCLNLGVLSLTVYTYGKNVEAAEEAAGAEQNYISMSFSRDYDDLTESSSSASPTLLMQTYGVYYEKRGVYLAFEEEGEKLYGTFPNGYKVEPDSIWHGNINGIRHVFIASDICDGKYTMIFAKNVAQLDEEFKSLTLTYGITAAGVSLLLAVCLYFILKKLSTPLEKLRKTTLAIEGGDFSVTAEESGNDEFTLLAKSFNQMLSKINKQIADLESNAEKKQLLVDNMAHELRTPLTSIYGYAEYLEKAAISEEDKIIAAKYIMSEAERLQKISELLLDSAYIRENAPKLERVELATVLADVASKLQPKAEQRGVTLTFTGGTACISGNATLLSMLFYNLAENAVKACKEGGKVALYCSHGIAAVEDTGKGMTAEQITHITEPFYRTDKSRARAEGGAGLGLALCKQIADVHGANLKFSSTPEVGTKVTVTFTT